MSLDVARVTTHLGPSPRFHKSIAHMFADPPRPLGRDALYTKEVEKDPKLGAGRGVTSTGEEPDLFHENEIIESAPMLHRN